MQRIKTERIQNTALLFMLVAPFTIAFYASYSFNPANAGNVWLYILQVTADGIAILNLGGLWVTILLDLIQPEYHKRKLQYDKKWIEKNRLAVDVLVPVSREPIEIIQKTVESAVMLEYPHSVYILDDGASPDVKTLAQQLGASYVSRPPHKRHFAKSGNLNFGLNHAKGEFFAVFDADHVPRSSFLAELLPFFENRTVGLVQTPQHYTNTKNFIASGTAQAQEIFYKYVQPAKNSYNASFCVGTNMIYRRSAIDEIGGVSLLDHSEDIWTTIELHERGYESVFYNKILADGRAPDTIPSFFRQQNRWAMGGFSLFFTHNPLFSSALSTDQRLQYFISNIHYFTAFSVFAYLLFPILYLLFNLHPMNVVEGYGWAVHYIPYFLTIYFLPLFLLGKFQTSTVSTAIASFVPYLRAFFSVVLKNKFTWIATEARRIKTGVIMTHIWPHVLIVILSLLSVVVGWYNVVDTTTTVICTFWAILNAYFLFAFIKNGVFSTSKS